MKCKKNFSFTVLMFLLLFLATLSGRQPSWDEQVLPKSWKFLPENYTIDSNDPFFVNAFELDPWDIQIYGKGEDGYSTPKMKTLPYLSSKSFTYPLGTYNNRTDVVHEIIDVETCYSHFAENASEEAVIAATEVYHQVMTDLVDLLETQYPLTDEQIFDFQKEYFYRCVEKKKEYHLCTDISVLNEKSVNDRLMVFFLQLDQEMLETAVRDFENGKITSQEACYLLCYYSNVGLPEDVFPQYCINFV